MTRFKTRLLVSNHPNLYMHQLKADWQQLNSINGHYANRHHAKHASQKCVTKRNHPERHHLQGFQ